MRYGFTTHALMASTAATAITIVTTQSTTVGQGSGSDSSRLRRKTGLRRLGQTEARRRPIDGKDGADEILAAHGSPLAAVAGLSTVVAHHEVLVGPERPLRTVEAGRAPVHVGLLERRPVHAQEAAPLRDGVAREADEPLDERAAGAAALDGLLRRLEDDDVAALGVAEAVDEAVGEDAVG